MLYPDLLTNLISGLDWGHIFREVKKSPGILLIVILISALLFWICPRFCQNVELDGNYEFSFSNACSNPTQNPLCYWRASASFYPDKTSIDTFIADGYLKFYDDTDQEIYQVTFRCVIHAKKKNGYMEFVSTNGKPPPSESIQKFVKVMRSQGLTLEKIEFSRDCHYFSGKCYVKKYYNGSFKAVLSM